MNEILIEKALIDLDFEQKKTFGFFCFRRVENLYNNVDEYIDISLANKDLPKGSAYETLLEMSEFLLKKNDNFHYFFNVNKTKVETLVLDIENIYENNIKNILAMLVAQNLLYLYEFEESKSNEEIFNCSENTLEIVNQLQSDIFFQKLKGDDEDLDSYLQKFFDNEYGIQLEAIELIKDRKFNDLNFLEKNTIIHYWNFVPSTMNTNKSRTY